MSHRTLLFGALAVSFLPACNGCQGEKPAGLAAASASASASAKAPRKPPRDGAGRWLRGLPQTKSTAKAGDRVWALAPTPGESTATFGVMEIESVQDDGTVTASPLVRSGDKLQRDDAAKRAGTPGALLTPAAPIDPATLKPNDLVIATIPGYRTTVAQVTKLQGNRAEVKYVKGDKVLDETVDYAVPLGRGVAPFALAAHFDKKAFRQVLIAAVVDERVYGIDDSGAVSRVEKRDMKPLDITLKDRKAGDVVVVFEGSGGSDTWIEREIVPKWIYAVRSNKDKPVPFWALVDKI